MYSLAKSLGVTNLRNGVAATSVTLVAGLNAAELQASQGLYLTANCSALIGVSAD